ncbi:hypothetical protein ADEAN_000189000 [Angomonas deanei]|uniref:DNA-PKcs N-terminal domain-containing protein n=1 Tax=Angomonas deanei TaxID=59799 RepID=A0A7G2C5K7_9TRYP|nr:hypothetical protein ADEAN_000189000 [Angomonas deanei]
MLELKLTQEIQGELNACHLFIKRRTYEDAIGPLTNIEKRVKDAMDHAAAEEDTRYALHKAIWGVLCGAKAEPKKKTSTAKHTEAPYTLLQCIQDVREKVSVSDDEAEGKVLKSSCTLLQTVLEWLSLRGLSRAQVLYVKEVAWKTFVTLSQMDKRSGTQGTCLAVLLYLVSHTAGPGHHWMTLTAEQLKAAEMMPHCLTLCDKRNASITGAKSFALQLLGAISLSFATSASVSAHFPAVFQTFLRTAERLQQSLNQTVGEGFFLGLCDFLKVYVLDFSNEAHKKHIIDLHQMVLNAFADACRAHNVANYKFCKAAMIFFQAHAEGALVECVVQDAQRYFGLLGDLWVHKNVDLHRCAYYAAATFFRAVGRHLASSNRPASVELLQYLMNELEAVLRDTQCSRQRLMFSVVAYGYMARPLAYLLGQEAVRRFFSQLAGRSDTLLSSFSSNREDAVRLMPQLLNAFAYFLYEMESISTVELDTIRTLLERTVEVYASDYFFEKIRAVTAPALMRLFTALQRHVASTSMVALFCAKLLQAVTGSGGASTTFPLELDEDDDAEEEGPEAVPAASRRPDRNGIAYGRVKTYAVFVQRLLCEESLLKESGWDYLWSVSEVRKAVEQVREELHLASLTLILQLDVSVQPSARGVGRTSTKLLPWSPLVVCWEPKKANSRPPARKATSIF